LRQPIFVFLLTFRSCAKIAPKLCQEARPAPRGVILAQFWRNFGKSQNNKKSAGAILAQIMFRDVFPDLSREVALQGEGEGGREGG
jgi:hypothetical protein